MRIGVAEVDDDAAVVLVHDAARPLLPDEVIERVLAALGEGWDGAVPGLPVVDTVKRVEDGRGRRDAPRAELVAVQTPQAFVASVLRAALAGDVSGASDCASLVEARGGRVKVVPGDPRLLKVTTPDDLALVESWLVWLPARVIVDYHMHLRDPDERIDHTVEAIERFVETAAERGVDEIGFTEHVYYFRQTREVWTLPYQTERCVYDLDAYVDAVARGEAAGPAGQARARGRLRRRAAGAARRAARALPVGLPARLGALDRRPRRRPGAGHLGGALGRGGLAPLLRGAGRAGRERRTSTCSRTPTWRRSSAGGRTR